MKKLLPLAFILIFLNCNQKVEYSYLFQNPELPFEQRVDNLISQLTLEEKASLMLYNSPAIERLGIQEYNWWNECLHGVARAGKATVFPQAIGLGATFDEKLINKVAEVISDEARAKHHEAVRKGNFAQYTGLSFWSPNVNIFRDPRWGRGQETYGEDPYLTGVLGSEFVKGLQGDNEKYLKVSAGAKHFAVHSGPEKSRHHFNALPKQDDFYDTYLPAFKVLIDAGVESVMCAYNRLYDEACCGSPFLLDSLLRQEWGFEGHVVSDCWALDDIWARHKIEEDKINAAVVALKSGVNLNCGYLYKYLPEAVEKDLIDEIEIDQALKPLLLTRFKLGLFDPDDRVSFSKLSVNVVNSEKHKQLAYEAAAKSVVLLKNNGILPLGRKELKKLFVTGPTAMDVKALVGNYNGFSANMVTILEGIMGKVDEGTVVNYSQGCLLNTDSVFNGFWQAGMSDVVVASLGMNYLLEGEDGDAMLNNNGGDRISIKLPRNQIEFIRLLREKIGDKPLIVVITGGSAIAIPEILNLADAVLFAWYPGEQGGKAVADIIFGDVNPSGRLPVTFYKSVDDLPAFDDYNMQGRTYRFFQGETLFPFGYGLSYTTFDFKNFKTNKEIYNQDEIIQLSLSVENTGGFDGDDVIQVYYKSVNSQLNKPIKSLIRFNRLSIKKGENKTIEISVPVKEMALWDINEKKYVVEPGKYQLLVSKNANDVILLKEIEIR
ncbi:MAG: glycoside hydrolase family 3 N-terminal domain-containing protein [Bacteroidota bacterium]